MSVIAVQDVWKQFKIPHERHDPIRNLAQVFSVFEGKRHSYEKFWALKQVTFSLQQGESLGIIGANGSGKSTLLKLLAGVMKPDQGKILTDDSVAAVLELGIGFHGDLTVRENALVYGVIMGLPRTKMKRLTTDILEFAGLTRFQDAKLKNLSSGMQVRLAFSIAIETGANLFLVDEALAVGDYEFQQKCLEKFREFKRQKKSIVLVSHDMVTIKDFCEKTLYLSGGTVRGLGPSRDVTELYVKDVKAPT